MPKKRKNTMQFPGIVILITLVAIAFALGFYGLELEKKSAAQNTTVISTPTTSGNTTLTETGTTKPSTSTTATNTTITTSSSS